MSIFKPEWLIQQRAASALAAASASTLQLDHNHSNNPISTSALAPTDRTSIYLPSNSTLCEVPHDTASEAQLLYSKVTNPQTSVESESSAHEICTHQPIQTYERESSSPSVVLQGPPLRSPSLSPPESIEPRMYRSNSSFEQWRVIDLDSSPANSSRSISQACMKNLSGWESGSSAGDAEDTALTTHECCENLEESVEEWLEIVTYLGFMTRDHLGYPLITHEQEIRMAQIISLWLDDSLYVQKSLGVTAKGLIIGRQLVAAVGEMDEDDVAENMKLANNQSDGKNALGGLRPVSALQMVLLLLEEICEEIFAVVHQDIAQTAHGASWVPTEQETERMMEAESNKSCLGLLEGARDYLFQTIERELS